MSSRALADAARIIVVASIYIIAGKLALLAAVVHPSASAVWPPTGISLAAFLLRDPRRGLRRQRHHGRLGGDRAGSRARIQVSDSGKGIPPEILPHVFEPFRQAGC